MSKTHKAEPFRPYRKEKAEARRQTARAFRARTRAAVRAVAAGRVEEDAVALPVFRGTCG